MVTAPPEPVFRLFVYGTLKWGFPNHKKFCATTTQIQTAKIRGRLFKTPFGHPVAELSNDEVLGYGSLDLRRDSALQQTLEKEAILNNKNTLEPQGSHGWVYGELLDFPNPDGWLSELDRFEEFDPVDGRSSFERVLVRAYPDHSTPVLAWVYRGASILNSHSFPELPDGRWQ